MRQVLSRYGHAMSNILPYHIRTQDRLDLVAKDFLRGTQFSPEHDPLTLALRPMIRSLIGSLPKFYAVV